MEVVKDKALLLCNYEVLAYLRSLQSGMKIGKQQQLATIVYETTKYLEDKPCNFQSPSIVKQFKSALAPYNLTKFEVLQILNERPTRAAEINPMIEECEERFNDTVLQDIVNIATSVLPTDESNNGD